MVPPNSGNFLQSPEPMHFSASRRITCDEEKSIKVHEKNIELLSLGIYNEWIDKSIEKLAAIVPARYAKPEVKSEFVRSMVPDPNYSKPQPAEPKPEPKTTDDTDSTVMIEAES